MKPEDNGFAQGERLTPKICSMRMSHDIRAEAQKEGMAAMAEKFREL